MTLRLNGTTSGYVEIDSAATSGNHTIVLPSSNGTANQFLKNGTTAGTLGWSSLVETATGVGIGTASPTSKLDLADTTADVTLSIRAGSTFSPSVYFEASGSNAAAIKYDRASQALIFANNSSSTERMRIDSAGSVSIQTSLLLRYLGANVGFFAYDPQSGLPTAGVVVAVNRGNDGSGSNAIGVSLGRSATSWSAYSDERGKANLLPIEDALFKVGALRAVTGCYVDDSEQTSRSFLIAQDVQAVLPEAVDVSDPDKLSLRYTEVIPLLVAALKESKERIETLEAANAALDTRLAALEAQQ